jgi:MFS family permease
MPNRSSPSRARLVLVLLGNALLRVANSAGGILVGFYLADLANQGRVMDAALVGTLGAVTFIAELTGALPMGVLSDALAPRALMVTGALLGALATQIFGMSSAVTIFFLSRALEGLAAAAISPSVLAHLTDVTDGDSLLRGKVMSYYELSLLAGIALGGVVGGSLFGKFGTGGFAAVAFVYLISAVLMGAGAAGSRRHGAEQAISGLMKALRDPYLLRLAPAWLCINAIVGLWLGPTLIFLLTLNDKDKRYHQFLTGVFVDKPEQVGYALLVYAMVFATGVTIWSFFLARFKRKSVLNIALVAMFFACLGFYLLNHSQGLGTGALIAIVVLICVSIMVESGFTPAALSLLADVVGAQGGRGAAMGIYSVLLSIGSLLGSLIGGMLGKAFAVDGLIYGTVAMALIAFVTVWFLPQDAARL